MALLKSKTDKTLKTVMEDAEVDFLAHAPDVPKELQSLTKPVVDQLRTLLSARLAVLNEEAKLKARLAEIERDKKALEAHMETIGVLLPKLGDDDEVEFDFAGAHVKIGKKGKSRELTAEGKKKLLDLLTPDDLFKLANFKLGDLDDYLTAKQRNEVLVENRTKRSLKVEPKAKK